MNSAKNYLKSQFKNPEFQQSFLSEKAQLDLEYQLEELKRNSAGCRPKISPRRNFVGFPECLIKKKL